MQSVDEIHRAARVTMTKERVSPVAKDLQRAAKALDGGFIVVAPIQLSRCVHDYVVVLVSTDLPRKRGI